MNRLILYALLSPWLLPAVVAASDSVHPNAVVAHVGETPIYAEEFTLHIRDQVALVAVHFKTRHQVDLSGNNWLRCYHNEIPVELLRQRSLASCRRAKAIQLLALKHELAEKLPFPGFEEVCEQINQARANGRAEGRVLYGPAQYSPAQLYKYKLTNMQNHLRDFIAGGGDQRGEALLEVKIKEQVETMPVTLKEDALNQLIAQQVGARAAQPYTWTSTGEGLFRDGLSFFLRGQSWSKRTAFTYKQGEGSATETAVKQALTDLNEIGVNTIRIYGSPDESDWAGSSNFDNLIKWIEEWNVANPDGGDPNKAMYYLVQLAPKDPQSSITSDLPEGNAASWERAINDLDNPGSIASMVDSVDTITSGSNYLLGYLIYHEFNVSSKYDDWRDAVGAQGIEDFMNAVAAALHTHHAPGKLVSHTGDAKEPADDIYRQIESLDTTDGNVLAKYDLIGFNLYISTDSLLKEDTYYGRIVRRRGFSVNGTRDWYIGETGASTDESANPGSVAAANYENPEGGANLQLMWSKTQALGDLGGFMLFTAQDNDLQGPVSGSIKQRGHFDYYGDKKFLYYIYADVVDERSTNHRMHTNSLHDLGVSIEEVESNAICTTYTVTFLLNNKAGQAQDYHWSIFRDDDGGSKQRFTVLENEAYEVVPAGQTQIVQRTFDAPNANPIFVASASRILDLTPSNPYNWGREHLLADAVCAVGGLNENRPGKVPQVEIKRFSVGETLQISSTGANTWTVHPEYSTNLADEMVWTSVATFSNTYAAGINTTLFDFPVTNASVFFRMREQAP